MMPQEYNEWRLTEYYCPLCGVKGLYTNDDNYFGLGFTYLCLNCSHSFNGIEYNDQQLTETVMQMRQHLNRRP